MNYYAGVNIFRLSVCCLTRNHVVKWQIFTQIKIHFRYYYARQDVVYCFMASAFLVLSVIDWRTYEIPFGINVFLFVLGIAMAVLDRGNLVEHLIGMVCVSGVLEILYLVSGGGAIGGGDIKLMFACGLILGWKLTLLAFVLGCIIGSVVHIIRMVRKKAGRMLAMGPYLSAGILLAALWGNRWISWYLSLIFN